MPFKHKKDSWDTWLAQLVDHMTLDSRSLGLDHKPYIGYSVYLKNEHMKRCSVLSIVGETQIKTTMDTFKSPS